MCSYIVEKTGLVGSAKGRKGWMRIDTANVYFDHPYYSTLDHVLAIDFANEAASPCGPHSRCVGEWRGRRTRPRGGRVERGVCTPQPLAAPPEQSHARPENRAAARHFDCCGCRTKKKPSAADAVHT
jgi:hypothetical protein